MSLNTSSTTTATTMSNTTTKLIREGSACMKVPLANTVEKDATPKTTTTTTATTVFYNPVQVQNRDLSVLMITLALERRALRKQKEKSRKNNKQTNKEPNKQYRAQDVEKDADSSATISNTAADTTDTTDAAAMTTTTLENTVGGTTAAKSAIQGAAVAQISADDDDYYDDVRILDALAASGLRSLRYWKEINRSTSAETATIATAGDDDSQRSTTTRTRMIHHITINDLDAAAVERAHENVLENQLQDVVTQEPFGYGIRIHQGDAMNLLYEAATTADPKRKWTVVDLDPYGSAARFLEGAIQAVENHGLLCVTSTDMAALGGSHPETCFGRYHSMPIQRAGYLQEMALRILLYSMATTAAKYGRVIQPVLSVGMDFYVRVFVEIVDSKEQVNHLSLKVGQVYQSTQCPSFYVVPSGVLGGKSGKVYQAGRLSVKECEETGATFKVGGPFWIGPLHDQEVVKEALKRLESSTNTLPPDNSYLATKDRLRGLLESCRDELNDAPLYYKLNDLCSTLKVPCPPLVKMKSAILNAGYQVSGYHKEPQAIKTNAPNTVVWDILRVWCRQQEQGGHWKKKPHPEGSTGAKILAKEPTTNVDFGFAKGAKSFSCSGVSRFPLNPEPHWGPKARATGNNNKKRKLPEQNNEDEDGNHDTARKKMQEERVVASSSTTMSEQDSKE